MTVDNHSNIIIVTNCFEHVLQVSLNSEHILNLGLKLPRFGTGGFSWVVMVPLIIFVGLFGLFHEIF